jgi:hypothetical protein
MKHPVVSRWVLAASCLGFLAFPWACAEKKPRGELMLAISADMSIPKNMNQVYVEVLDETGSKSFATYPLRPEALGQPMPGSLAIIPPDGGGQKIRIRLRAEHDNANGGDPTVRVVREAVVKIPTGRTAMLTMPLRWLCDGKHKQQADGSWVSDCPNAGDTCAAGVCVTADVDSNALPDYNPALIYGGGDENGNGGTCMDVIQCFATSTDVQPDANCVIPVPPGVDAGSINVAMLTGNEGDGICPDSGTLASDNPSSSGGDLSGAGGGTGGSHVAAMDGGATAEPPPNSGFGGASTGTSGGNAGSAGMSGGIAGSAGQSSGIGGAKSTGGASSGGNTAGSAGLLPMTLPSSAGSAGTSSSGTTQPPSAANGSAANGSAATGPCYVPLDKDPTEGWSLTANGDIQLPTAVCDRLNNHLIQGVRVTTACKSKDLTVPICGTWSNVGSKETVGPNNDGTGAGGSVNATPDGGKIDVGMGGTGGAPFRDGGSTCTSQGSGLGMPASKLGGTLYLVVDTSMGMMLDASTWTNLVNGVSTFASSTQTPISVALEFVGQTCADMAFQLPPTTVPQGAPQLQSVLTARSPTSVINLDYGTALKGAYSMSGRGSASAVILLTAGATNSTCPASTDPVMAAQTAATTGMPTYVLAFPGNTDLTQLSAIAQAGGTTLTTLDSVSGPAQVANALEGIAATVGGCTYRWDPSATGVELSTAGSTTQLTRLDGAAACSSLGGYTVSADGTSFTLCPTQCGQVSIDPNTTVMLAQAGAGGGGCSHLGMGGSTGLGGANAGGGGGVPSGQCTTDADCPGRCCVKGPQVCGDVIAGTCMMDAGVGGFGGTGGGAGGTAGMGGGGTAGIGGGGVGATTGAGGTTGTTCMGVGQGGTAPTQSTCDACLTLAAGNPCSTCECQQCLAPDTSCSQDAGCQAIEACMQATKCSTPAQCYTAATCQSQIDAYGGMAGQSVNLAMQYYQCVMKSCGICGG